MGKLNLPKPSPDFDRLLKLLRRENPNRATLFEFFMHDRIYNLLCQGQTYNNDDGLGAGRQMSCD